MRQVISKDVVTGFKRVLFCCDHCGHPHPNLPNSFVCRRCAKKSTVFGTSTIR